MNEKYEVSETKMQSVDNNAMAVRSNRAVAMETAHQITPGASRTRRKVCKIGKKSFPFLITSA